MHFVLANPCFFRKVCVFCVVSIVDTYIFDFIASLVCLGRWIFVFWKVGLLSFIFLEFWSFIRRDIEIFAVG